MHADLRHQLEFYSQGLNDAFAAQRWTDVQNIAANLLTLALRRHLDAEAKPVAWLTADNRVVTNATKEQLLAKGEAWAVREFTTPLYTAEPLRAGVTEDAVERACAAYSQAASADGFEAPKKSDHLSWHQAWMRAALTAALEQP